MENNTVEMMATQVQDDAALTAQEPQTLADVLGATTPEQPTVETTETAEQTPPKEPGWIKQRVGAAVNKAVAEAEARIRAEYEAQLAPLREAELEREADKLVADGTIKNREIALEYVRNRKNAGSPKPDSSTASAAPARDEHGRFVGKESTPEAAQAKQRADMLVAQADALKRTSGVDLMALYNTDVAVRQKILSGEWDFVDVLNHTQQNAAPSVPAPTRSANMTLGGMSISKMNDSQLDKLNDLLRSGGKINV